MERYINVNDITLKGVAVFDENLDLLIPLSDVRKALQLAPTADVVPKSEVERLTVEIDAMRGAANTYKMHYENARKEIERLKDYNTGVAFKYYFDGRKEVAREIFEDIERSTINSNFEFMFVSRKYFAELKKKYTGEQT